jgi:Uri superfamily endonuclease
VRSRDLRKIGGIYVLFISVKRSMLLKVGALGKIELSKGTYTYVGSARNGIKTRVARHLKKEKRKFWHIDYLLAQENARIEKVIYKEALKEEECRMAQTLCKFGSPVRGFGCSDCSCCSHLFKIEETALFEIMGSYGGDPWLALRTPEQKRPEFNVKNSLNL